MLNPKTYPPRVLTYADKDITRLLSLERKQPFPINLLTCQFRERGSY